MIYGTLRESGSFKIKVHAINSKYDSEMVVELYTSEKTGEATGVEDVLSENEDGKLVTYDMLGRRVSPENMGGKSVFIIKKKIVIRK